MFVGMEHIVLSNLSLADEALFAAHSMCDADPLLANERGVMAYNHGQSVTHCACLTQPFAETPDRYERAAESFQHALNLAQVTQSSEAAWATTYVNLGTCYRKLEYVVSPLTRPPACS